MAYATWSVVFGETPSASKWNILGTNDAYFDDEITQINARSVLGVGTRTSTFNFTTRAQITDVTTGSVTVPNQTDRYLVVTLFCPNVKNDNASTTTTDVIEIWDGTVGSGTLLSFSTMTEQAQFRKPMICQTPPLLIGTGITAGAHTFNGAAAQGSGTGNVLAATTAPAFIAAHVI